MNNNNNLTENMDLPLVSVVIPVANAEEFIEDAIHSVLQQTYCNLELIVVDDSSDDNTATIACKIMRNFPWTRLIRLSCRSGVAAARNAGIKACKGAFIATLDADDIWMPDKIAYQTATMIAAGETVGMVYCWTRRIYVDGWPAEKDVKKIVIEGDIAPHLMGNGFTGGGSTPLFRREIVEEVGGYDTSLFKQGIQGAEDIDFYLRVAKKTMVALVPMQLVDYRVAPNSMSSNSLVSLRSSFVARKRFKELRKEGYLEKKYAALCFYQSKFRPRLSEQRKDGLEQYAKELDPRVKYRAIWVRILVAALVRQSIFTVRTSIGKADRSLSDTFAYSLSSEPVEDHSSTLVSIVIPAFNMEPYVRQTIRSALNQTHAHIEVLIIDDCSTDATVLAAKELEKKDSRVSTHRLSHNSGVCVTRNEGLHKSHGKYVVFLDADDVLLPTAIEGLLNAIAEKPESAIAYGGRVHIDAQGQVLCNVLTALTRSIDVPGEGFISRNLVGCGSGALILRSAALLVGGYDESLRETHGEICADWIFYMSLTTVGSVGVYKGCVVAYRQHDSSMSSSRESQLSGYRSAFLAAKRLYPECVHERKVILGNAYFLDSFWLVQRKQKIRAVVPLLRAFLLTPSITWQNLEFRYSRRILRRVNALEVRIRTGIWPRKITLNKRIQLNTFLRLFKDQQPAIRYTRGKN